MNDTDDDLSPTELRIHHRLQRAAARLSASGDLATDAALDTVMSGRPPRRRRRRWAAAAAAATTAAALVAAVVVIDRADGGLAVPAAASIPTSLSLPRVFAGPPYAEDFDADGGRCVSVAFDDTSLSGCFTGHLIRSRVTAHAAVDGEILSISPDPSGGLKVGPAAFDDPAFDCFADLLEGDTPHLTVVLGCVDGQAVLGHLSKEPTEPIEWSLADSAAGATEVDLAASPSSPDSVHVFTAATEPFPGWDDPRCVIVVAGSHSDSGRRHACLEATDSASIVAGTSALPVHVEIAPQGRVSAVRALNRDTALLSNGCLTPIGEILDAVSEFSTIRSLQCAGRAEAIVGLAGVLMHPGVRVSTTYYTLDLAADVISTDNGEYDRVDCEAIADTCNALRLESGDIPLPIPPADTIEQITTDVGTDHAMPFDVTARFAELPGQCCPDQLADAVVARIEGDIPEADVSVSSTSNPAIIVVDRVPDDAAARITYVIWMEKTPEMVKVGKAYSIATCRRGVVEDAGELLCV